MKVATYSRVSTARSGQKPEVQVEELRRYCQARGIEITHEIVDRATGSTDKRPALKRLLELARAKDRRGRGRETRSPVSVTQTLARHAGRV